MAYATNGAGTAYGNEESCTTTSGGGIVSSLGLGVTFDGYTYPSIVLGNGQVNYPLNNEQAEIIGFFSTEHKTIFTHHDTFLHIHLMTTDKQKMGHLDEVWFKKGRMKLYLPTE